MCAKTEERENLVIFESNGSGIAQGNDFDGCAGDVDGTGLGSRAQPGLVPGRAISVPRDEKDIFVVGLVACTAWILGHCFDEYRFSSQGRSKLRVFPHPNFTEKHETKPFLDSKTLYFMSIKCHVTYMTLDAPKV